MPSLLERLGASAPVVQAGMGGGVAGPELPAAVAEVGGVGLLGIVAPARLAAELAEARRLTDGPVGVTLNIPLARAAHWRAAASADLVVTFWGRPRRRTAGVWVHHCGTVAEALAARDAGADGVIVQGVEAGGHVRGRTPARDLLAAARGALGGTFPVWLAGGIAERADTAAALELGAEAVVAGTRFVLSEESRAHPGYKDRLVAADTTLLTELFGVGWPLAPHRVLPNEATERWCARDRRGPAALRALHAAVSPLALRSPASLQARLIEDQRPGRPLLSAQPPVADGPSPPLDAAPLYAGESVARLHDVRPAAALVAELTP